MNGTRQRLATAMPRAGLLAAICVLALALACAQALARPQAAYAEPATNCTFDVKANTENVTVDAYQLFVGDVDDTTNAISNVEWASDAKSPLLAFLDQPVAITGANVTYGTWLYQKGLATTDLTNVSTSTMTSSNRAAHDSAENALAYIVEQINASAGIKAGKTGPTVTAARSFSNNLAEAVVNDLTKVDTKEATVSPSDAHFEGLTEGFYLFNISGYSPIWTPVGGTEKNAQIKDQTVLTVSKEVFDEETQTWGKIADAGSSGPVTFRVTGTLPSGNTPGSGYWYELSDSMSDGLTIYSQDNEGEMLPVIEVFAVDSSGAETDITDRFTATELSDQVPDPVNTLRIFCADLYDTGKAHFDEIKAAEKIVFQYKATVNVEATFGTSYNVNEATLKYGSADDPFITTPDSVNVATYKLLVEKKDSESGSALAGAEFEITTTVDGQKLYLQSDGTLKNTPWTFQSNADGELAVFPIDAGTYVVTETEPPSGYKKPASPSTTVVITATKDQDSASLTDLAATANNKANVSASVGSGIVTLTIDNEQNTVLPITGMTPDQTGTVIGILLVAAGAIVLVVRARRKAQSAR